MTGKHGASLEVEKVAFGQLAKGIGVARPEIPENPHVGNADHGQRDHHRHRETITASVEWWTISRIVGGRHLHGGIERRCVCGHGEWACPQLLFWESDLSDKDSRPSRNRHRSHRYTRALRLHE